MGDIDEIRNLQARYCHHLDSGGENRQLAHLFVEDGQFVLLGQTYVGRAAIQGLFDMFEAHSPRGLHVTVNPAIDVDGDRATSASDWLFFEFKAAEGSWSLFAGGNYRDVFVREAGGWRFQRRTDTLRGNATISDLTA